MTRFEKILTDNIVLSRVLAGLSDATMQTNTCSREILLGHKQVRAIVVASYLKQDITWL